MLRNLIAVDPYCISVVIQGPLYRNLGAEGGIQRCIASIHEHLPGAEIIVSTWKYESIQGLEHCKVALLEEPRAFYDIYEKPINTNRQIQSTLAGIKLTTRQYVLKFRADHFLTGRAIASIAKYNEIGERNIRLLKCPITVTNLYIRNPVRVPMLFHLSDIIQFGLREDMLQIWDQNLVTEKEHLIENRVVFNPFGNYIGHSNLRVIPEQAIAIGWLKRSGLDISLNHACHVSTKMLTLWESILITNFSILNWQQADIHFPPRFLVNKKILDSLYSSEELDSIQKLSPLKLRLRRFQVWLNQYVFSLFSSYWLVSTASGLLFSISPRFQKKIRTIWHKIN